MRVGKSVVYNDGSRKDGEGTCSLKSGLILFGVECESPGILCSWTGREALKRRGVGRVTARALCPADAE